MSRTQIDPVVRQLYRMAGADRAAALSDAELLRHFAQHREEAAFSALLERHGDMVMGVCRRVLARRHDAEDAFQATFLALVRHASSIRQTEAVASWLYRVAHRIATRAGLAMARRTVRERQSGRAAQAAPSSETALRELQDLLDEEVRRLPEKYRAPFVLCCLEGKGRTEAARELGWKEGTVAGRLAEARKRLQARLARRGVVLSAALTVVALAPGAGAAVGGPLFDATLKAATQYASGGAVSASVAGLVEGATTTMLTAKAKTATALLVLGLLTAGALALYPRTPSPLPAQDARAAEKKPADPDEVELKGRVLGPDGKPVAGARLFLVVPSWGREGKAKPGVRARSDQDGRFRFAVPRGDLGEWARVVATADGHGMDWVKADGGAGDLALRLVKDVPITGRVLDLEGLPVAGVAVHVDRIQTTAAEDLTPVLKAWQENSQRAMNVLDKHLYQPEAAGVLAKVLTDAQGRFRISGVGRERMAVLKLQGDTVEHKALYVFCRPRADIEAMIRPDPDKMRPGMPRMSRPTVYGPAFEHAAVPVRPIVGVVRDRATGKPVRGAGISGSASDHHWEDYARAETDAEGRFRLTGVPKGRSYRVSAYAAQSGYLPAMKTAADTGGLTPLTVDFELVRGVKVQGRITDKTTGKPVDAAIWYYPLADNKAYRDLPGNEWYRSVSQGHRTNRDGTFNLLALPGPGLVLVRAEGAGMKLYTQAALDPAHRARSYRPDEEDEVNGPAFLSVGGAIQHLMGHHAYRLIDPAQGAATLECDVALDRGQSRDGTVVGPDGKPLAGATAIGLAAVGGGPSELAGASFTARALDPGQPRKLAFVHKGLKLAGQATLRGDEKAPVTVKLEPWGVIAGRALDEEGNPLADAELSLHFDENAADWLFRSGREKLRTDQAGCFRVEGLFPGVPFGLGFIKKGTFRNPGEAYRKLSVTPGQTKDLGDVKTTIYRLD